MSFERRLSKILLEKLKIYKQRQTQIRYYKRHTEVCRKRIADWQENNKDKVREIGRKCHSGDEYNRKRREYYQKNKEKINGMKKEKRKKLKEEKKKQKPEENTQAL